MVSKGPEVLSGSLEHRRHLVPLVLVANEIEQQTAGCRSQRLVTLLAQLEPLLVTRDDRLLDFVTSAGLLDPHADVLGLRDDFAVRGCLLLVLRLLALELVDRSARKRGLVGFCEQPLFTADGGRRFVALPHDLVAPLP